MSDPPQFSILIVNYNAGAHLERCLHALRAQTIKAFEAIIVDNDSRDDSLARCAEHLSDPRFRLVRMFRNAGFAAGNNQGAALARAEWIVTLNPDAFPEPGWLAALSRAVREYPDVDMFGSTQISASDPSRLDGGGDAYLAIGVPWRGGYGHPTGKPEHDYETFGPCAAAAMYKAATFRHAGGFDEDFFCYVEDADLAFRIRLSGGRCVQLHDAVVRHVGGATSDSSGRFARYHGIRNLIWTFAKNVPAPMFWALLPLHVIALLTLLVKAVYRGNAAPIFNGIRDAVCRLPSVWKKRQQIQEQRCTRTRDIARAFCWKPWTYFSKGVHKLGPPTGSPDQDLTCSGFDAL
jgi:GT2 family glycosyltransferase